VKKKSKEKLKVVVSEIRKDDSECKTLLEWWWIKPTRQGESPVYLM